MLLVIVVVEISLIEETEIGIVETNLSLYSLLISCWKGHIESLQSLTGKASKHRLLIPIHFRSFTTLLLANQLVLQRTYTFKISTVIP